MEVRKLHVSPASPTDPPCYRRKVTYSFIFLHTVKLPPATAFIRSIRLFVKLTAVNGTQKLIYFTQYNSPSLDNQVKQNLLKNYSNSETMNKGSYLQFPNKSVRQSQQANLLEGKESLLCKMVWVQPDGPIRWAHTSRQVLFDPVCKRSVLSE